MSRHALAKGFTLAATLALALAAVWLSGPPPTPSPGRPAHSQPGPRSSRPWTELVRPTLVDDPANDGDSFLLRHQGGRHLMRLYFVDCPEKKRHPLNRHRLADQGAAFGGLTEAETVELGRQARQFTLNLLRTRPIRAFTTWEQVFDSQRHYAHLAVILPDGSQRWLADLLIEAGLARLHTKGAPLPDGTPHATAQQRLRSLEKSARLAGRGGWATHAVHHSNLR